MKRINDWGIPTFECPVCKRSIQCSVYHVESGETYYQYDHYCQAFLRDEDLLPTVSKFTTENDIAYMERHREHIVNKFGQERYDSLLGKLKDWQAQKETVSA